MQNINYERIIAVLGMCIWILFPVGMFVSLVRQDRQALPPPKEAPEYDKNEHLNIFGHEQILYNDEAEAEIEIEIEIEAITSNIEDLSRDEDFIHPHAGIGSSHSHHVQ